MRTKKPLAVLLFACSIAMLSTVLMVALTSGGSRAMAQTGPGPVSPAGIESEEAIEEGPVIKVLPKASNAVNGVAQFTIIVTNQHTVDLYYVRTDFEPSPPVWVAASTCPRLNQVATDTFQSPMEPGTSVSYSCAITVNTGISGTLPFSMRVRSIDPTGAAPFLGDADAATVVVASPQFNHFLYLPMIKKGT